ncbi:MAG: M18 family aminopeptidase [Firmicutes bacterium]|nr:M18 family aminopeptidase [Bacillota bacterium]MCM1401648.1 M18 family aminopeptidase [Bacteroides sp.]MCM1477534.1 M18 family aminopeptidase [Bacteroides sp.]
MNNNIGNLIEFLNASPVNFLAAKEIASRLDAAGYVKLSQEDEWTLKKGGKYYITKNDSAVMAFNLSAAAPSAGYKIISAHSDSPCFRIKPNAAMLCENGVVKLNTEVYGGPILYTWFDRPLSLAGRVVLRSDNPLHPASRTLMIKRPLLTIPHLAIHFNRAVNEGNPLSKQKDMLPVIAIVNNALEANGLLLNLIATELGVDKADILDFDLSLYDVTPACTLGLDNEFISAGRLDDLSMAHAALTALLNADDDPDMNRVMAIFDNEETGSGTKQGAASPLLMNLLRRINECLGGTEQDYQRAIARSFMISADNGHALHPNYPEKQDPTNHPALGKGPVIKINANCKYMTDADSAAVFATICERAGVPVQYFVNHSDVAGGSTLGNILTSQIDLRGVDMGAAIWAMHSVRETGSVRDVDYIIRAFTTFYSPL